MEPPPLPNGPVFFSARTDPATKRRRIWFMVIFTLTMCTYIWPIYPMFSGIYPLVLGVPFSFAWVIGGLWIVFFALVWLYRTEHPSDETTEGA